MTKFSSRFLLVACVVLAACKGEETLSTDIKPKSGANDDQRVPTSAADRLCGRVLSLKTNDSDETESTLDAQVAWQGAAISSISVKPGLKQDLVLTAFTRGQSLCSETGESGRVVFSIGVTN